MVKRELKKRRRREKMRSIKIWRKVKRGLKSKWEEALHSRRGIFMYPCCRD